MTNQINHISQD